MDLPGSKNFIFPCTLIHQALDPSPLDCDYFNTKIIQGITHEYCGNLEITSIKNVKGGSWSKENRPPCYLCKKYKKVNKES